MGRVSHDLIIRNAMIVDGTGGPAVAGDVAVSNGVIAEVGPTIGGVGAEEVDAAGSVVAPGFIDPHTHLDANLFWDADVTPSSSFGVTTVVTANCGYGLAPISDVAARDYVVETMSTVEQIPVEAVTEGVPFGWSDLASYFDCLDQLPVLLNHASLVGHVPLRAAVLGVPDVHTRAATPSELSEMAALLSEGLALGALGFSTDQVIENIGPNQTPLPGQVCAAEELLAMAETLGRGPGPGLFTLANAAMLQSRTARAADLAWHERLAQRSGRPVVVGPVFDSHDDPGDGLAILDLTLAGARPGVQVVPQIATRPFEIWTRLDAPGMLVRAMPTLAAAVAAGGMSAVRDLADDPDRRRRLRDEGDRIAPNPVFSGRWDHVFVRYTGQAGEWDLSLGTVATDRAVHPVDLMLDLALADGFDTQFAIAMRNADDAILGQMVGHPAAVIGASDAGAHVLSNTDSCYAVWTLQHWVRERQVLTLERAVAMLTGTQADLFGLGDRGRIRVGLAADLVVFDPDTIATTGVRYVADQPAGGRRLITDATGIELTVVNGVVATRGGVSTGARSGRRLRPTGEGSAER